MASAIDQEFDVESFIKGLKTENEQKLLCFYMKNPLESVSFSDQFFLHPASRAIFNGVKTIVERKLHFDIDTLLTLSQENYKHANFELIDGIYNKFSDFENIDFVKETVKNDHLKFVLKTRIFKELWPKAIQADSLTVDDVKKFAESILYEASAGSTDLLTTEELADNHIKVIEDRDYGLIQRSLGYSKLDKSLTRPGAAEEITILTAQKGAGKSGFTKNIENNLINKKVCVFSLNLEMSQASNMDRMLCIRNGFTLNDLNQQNMDPDFKQRVLRSIEEIRSIKNYVYSPLETMTLTDLDTSIYKAKMIFRQRGVLPDDEYMMVTIDSLDMIKGFDEPLEIKKNVDVLARIARKHKIHILALVQLNEDKFRGKHFNDPDDIDKIKFTYTDIYGGSYYAARARVVITLNRPKQLRMQLFPDMEDKWKLEDDILQVVIAKQNDGAVSGFLNFMFDGPGMRITQCN